MHFALCQSALMCAKFQAAADLIIVVVGTSEEQSEGRGVSGARVVHIADGTPAYARPTNSRINWASLLSKLTESALETMDETPGGRGDSCRE